MNKQALAQKLLKLAAEIDVNKQVQSLGSSYLCDLVVYKDFTQQYSVLLDKILEKGLPGNIIDNAVLQAFIVLLEPLVVSCAGDTDGERAAKLFYDLTENIHTLNYKEVIRDLLYELQSIHALVRSSYILTICRRILTTIEHPQSVEVQTIVFLFEKAVPRVDIVERILQHVANI